MKQLSEQEALNKAAVYCTQCERCTSEVVAKLTAWGMTSSQKERITATLTDEKFIDDERFCRAFVNDKLRFNRWGRIKIAAALREKRLPQASIKKALEQIDEKEYSEILLALLNSKRKEIKAPDSYTASQKLLRFAAGRGFEPGVVMKLLKFNPDEMDF